MLTLTVDKHHIPGDYPPEKLDEWMNEIQAVIYARVSTQDQARHGYSLESQVERAAELAKVKLKLSEQQLLAVVEQGEMGDDPARSGLNQVLWFIEHGIGTKIIVLHPDRLARDLKLQLYITERIWNAGCEILFVEMDVDKNNPESLLLYNIQGAIAQYNKAKILANSKRGRRAKIRNGKIPGLRRAYGYSFDTTLDTLVENAREKAVYLMMVDFMLNGKDGRKMTLSGIARELSMLGYQAPGGGKWYQTTISRILKNPLYTGKFYYGKTEVKQHAGRKHVVRRPSSEWQAVPVPAYIDEETFRSLQVRLHATERRGRGRRPSAFYLVKGLVRCGRCGRTAVAGPPSRDKQTGQPARHYYVCSGKSRQVFEVGTGQKVHSCKGRNWRQDVIDEVVWQFVLHVLQGPDGVTPRLVAEWTKDFTTGSEDTRLRRLEDALHEKQKERRRWLVHSAKNRISDDELDAVLTELNRGIGELEAAVAEECARRKGATEMTEDACVESCTLELRRYLQSGVTHQEKQDIVQALIEKVVLYDEKIEVYTRWRSEEEQSNQDAGSHNSNHRQEHGGLS